MLRAGWNTKVKLMGVVKGRFRDFGTHYILSRERCFSIPKKSLPFSNILLKF